MNSELLKKCLSGEASDSEWEIYQNWMDGDIPEDNLENLGSDEFFIKHRILTSIQVKNTQNQLQRGQLKKLAILVSGIAASLCCVIYLSFFNNSQPQKQRVQVFTYNSNSISKENNFNGIIVKLAKNSKISLNQLSATHIDLKFLGSVMLSNTSTKDQNVIIQHGKGTIKKMHLRKGHSYLLSTLNFKYEEVILVDKQKMNDIPPALALNMQQQFVL